MKKYNHLLYLVTLAAAMMAAALKLNTLSANDNEWQINQHTIDSNTTSSITDFELAPTQPHYFSSLTVNDIGKNEFSDGFYTSPWLRTKANSWTNIRSNYKKASSRFVTQANNTPFAITFSGETYIYGNNKRILARVLVDGIVQKPTNVIFASGYTRGNRSFTFTGVANKGIHTVEVQWWVDSGQTAYIKNVNLTVRQSSTGSLKIKTKSGGSLLSNSITGWKDINGLSTTIYARKHRALTVTLSAETKVTDGKRVWVQALINGKAAKPGNMVITSSNSFQSRRITFGLPAVETTGYHDIKLRWYVANGGTGYLGDRSMVVETHNPANNDLRHYYKTSANGSTISNSSTAFTPIPDMKIPAIIPPNSELAVSFSAEAWSSSSFAMSKIGLKVNGQLIDNSMIEFVSNDKAGANSHTFSVKNFDAGGDGCICYVELVWKSTSSQNSVYLADRSMTVWIKNAEVPDMASHPNFSQEYQNIVPMRGDKKLLTIMIDPQRPEHPAPSINQLESLLFTDPNSVKNYYLQNSDNKFNWQNAGILSYSTNYPASHYWNQRYPSCENNSTIYKGGHNERWSEAIIKASNDINFASYDKNKDGYLSPYDELSILVVTPQTDIYGVVRFLGTKCDGANLTVDGVIIPKIAESMFTSNTSQSRMNTAHELAHLMFNFTDGYSSTENNIEFGIEPLEFDLMSRPKNDNSHFNAFHKLSLGWITPKIIEQSGSVTLANIKQSKEALVLPRKNGAGGEEYYLLENVSVESSQPALGAIFGDDEQPNDKGIAVWHVIETSPAMNNIPHCWPLFEIQSVFHWFNIMSPGPRKGMRLLRPSVTTGAHSLWSNQSYTLNDTNIVCSTSPTQARNILDWHDVLPSGYKVYFNSPPGEEMDLFISAPN